MAKALFQEDVLEALLGDYRDDFDIDGIIEDATYIDYSDGNRYWKDMDEDEMNEILMKHDKGLR